MAFVQLLPSMRIVALPLRLNASVRPIPTFYSYRIIAPPPRPKPAPRTRWLPEEGLGKWTAQKAQRTWATFGAAEKGTWKQRAFTLGERLMDRLDFEESNLKTLDLSIAPPLKVDGAIVPVTPIPLLYPPAALSGPQALDNLRALVKERIPLHQRGVWTYTFFAVLSAPLKLIPIIPNFPFYFCAWRTYSHWKALRAARYLRSLLDANRIVPEPHGPVDAVYTGEEEVSITEAARVLDMQPEERKELVRACEQVRTRVGSRKEKGV